MDENKMGWCEYARYAAMAAEELARDCEYRCFARRVRADKA